MLVSKKHKALILRLRDPNKVLTVIPSAKLFSYQGKEYVAVRHGPDETKVLRNIGIEAPSPILYHYEWPGRYSPYDHQRHTAAFMAMENRAFNLNGMGTGKTMSVLWAYDFLRRMKAVRRALVISPLSTLERTWADEVFNHFSHLTTVVLYGNRERRLALLNQDADIYLINHDGIKVSGFVEAMAERGDIDLIIVDEIAQVARNAGTDRFKALMTIVNRQTPRRAWGLTGTPTPNAPTDAWAQCRLLVPENVPLYFNRFKDQVMRQISTYVWVPRPNATEVVHEAMQPSIRYALEDCIDLPPCVFEVRQAEMTREQQVAYKDMLTKLRIEAADGSITAANEAVKAQKLIQIACLSYNTPVLTIDGWVPIQNVTSKHKVWDGENWVAQKGAMYMGDKAVTSCFGVLMTGDHKVLTTRGWVTAEDVNNEQKTARASGPQGKRLDREQVRLPDGFGAGGVNRADGGIVKTRNLAVPLRLRKRGCTSEPVPPYEAPSNPTKLRMPPRERQAQDDQYASVQRVGKNEVPLLESFRQGLEKLRGAWGHCLRTVATFIRELPPRRFRWLQERLDSRQNGQRRPILSGELPVGNAKATGEQHKEKSAYRYSEGSYDDSGSSSRFRHEEDNASCKDLSEQVACGESAVNPGDVVPVFDLVDCGPRNRFVVLGSDMRPLIVHNCGTVYDGEGGEIMLDHSPRMEVLLEVIEQAGAKVIVFVPFVAMIEKLVSAIHKNGYTAEAIYGDVSKSDRDRILNDFQRAKDPHVIVAQPGTMSHGLTLTAADTIVWYAPIPSNDIFQQANARISRPGQTKTQLIVMIEGTDIERKYYTRLKDKQRVQGLLLDMVRDSK